ncbi:MAG: DUF1801 domain-containing protein [Planctomycetota bacterium]|jgi:hypothetical protein
MAKKKAASRSAKTVKSFTGLIRGRSKPVQQIAKTLKTLVLEELPDAHETFHSGRNALAMYRTIGEVCWIQPLTHRCNVYFTRGTELTDEDGLLEGKSDRQRFVKVPSLEAIDELPLREWIRESVELNVDTVFDCLSFDEVLERLRGIALALPNTKETLTWGKPHFRVGEKIFCGCGEQHGCAKLGLKAEQNEAPVLMKLPGIVKAPYSRPNDGWIQIDPAEFDDWDEIERLVIGSFRLIAPKKVAALLD